MDGKDAGGLGGIHKLQFVYPFVVYASKPQPGQSPSDVLSGGPSFHYLRQYGLATFGGTQTGGSVLVRLYVYAGYSYRFLCYVGLPLQSSAPAAAAAANVTGFKIAQRTSSTGGPVKLLHFAANAVSGIGDPPTNLGGIVRLRWDIEPQALPGAIGIEIHQDRPTQWSFHFCSIARFKA